MYGKLQSTCCDARDLDIWASFAWGSQAYSHFVSLLIIISTFKIVYSEKILYLETEKNTKIYSDKYIIIKQQHSCQAKPEANSEYLLILKRKNPEKNTCKSQIWYRMCVYKDVKMCIYENIKNY